MLLDPLQVGIVPPRHLALFTSSCILYASVLAKLNHNAVWSFMLCSRLTCKGSPSKLRKCPHELIINQSCPQDIACCSIGENSPLVINHNLVVCRSAKVASTALRTAAFAIKHHVPYSPVWKENQRNELDEVWKAGLESRTLDEVATFRNNQSEVHRLLYSPEVRRVMWVRHPVSRILSAYMEFLLGGILVEISFEEFVFSFVTRFYDPSCSIWSTWLSLDGIAQHVFPSQHCRCNIPCGVSYELHHLETTRSVVADLYEMAGIAWRARGVSHVNDHSYNVSSLLTPRIISHLNTLTYQEQLHLGYTPYIEQQ